MSARPHYHDTGVAKADRLDQYEAEAKTQDETILKFYEGLWPVSASPSQIQLWCGLDKVPLTSVRRAITNLTRDGLLTKTGRQILGPYGRPENTWRFVKPAVKRQETLF